MLSGMFGFDMNQVSGKPPKLQIFLNSLEVDSGMDRIGYFDMGRPDSNEFPFLNDTNTLGYDIALDASRIALATLYRNATLNRFDW